MKWIVRRRNGDLKIAKAAFNVKQNDRIKQKTQRLATHLAQQEVDVDGTALADAMHPVFRLHYEAGNPVQLGKHHRCEKWKFHC
jgi:hypothetical protein